MGRVTINGKSYSGMNIRINNGKIYVDGKETDPVSDKIISVSVDGDVQSIETDSAMVGVKGKVGSVKTVSGNVEVHNSVLQGVQTVSGDVTAKEIYGNISTVSGDINRK